MGRRELGSSRRKAFGMAGVPRVRNRETCVLGYVFQARVVGLGERVRE